MNIPKLEAQITILKKQRDGKVYQSPSWYALEGKIKKQTELLNRLKQMEFEAR